MVSLNLGKRETDFSETQDVFYFNCNLFMTFFVNFRSSKK